MQNREPTGIPASMALSNTSLIIAEAMGASMDLIDPQRLAINKHRFRTRQAG